MDTSPDVDSSSRPHAPLQLLASAHGPLLAPSPGSVIPGTFLLSGPVTDDPRQYSGDKHRWDDDGPAVTMREMLLRHDRDIEGLKLWRSELRGAMQLVKITMGTSLISGALAAIALADLLLRGGHP